MKNKQSLFMRMLMYSLPLMATALLQVLFNTADLAVVGQFCGALATASVGATTSLMHLIIGLFLGISTGVCVIAAQAFGAKDTDQVKTAVHTALIVSVFAGVFVGAIGFVFSGRFLHWMDTPEEVVDGAVTYLRICFLGVPFMMIYNFLAAIFRAVGDSKRPLYILTGAGVLNVVLNVVLVAAFHLDVAGVAIATAVSQAGSAVAVILLLCRKDCPWRLERSAMHINGRTLGKILRIGIPAGIQSCLFSISNVLLQSAVNSLGAATVSACAACSTIEDFACITTSQYSQTAVTFTGQAVGANERDKIHSILRNCMISVTILCVLLCGVTILFRYPLLRIFVPDSEEAIALGAKRLLLLNCTYFLCAYMDVLTGMLRGLGASLSPTIITVICIIGMRFFWIFGYFPNHRTLIQLFLSYPISWAVCTVGLIFTLELHLRKFRTPKNV